MKLTYSEHESDDKQNAKASSSNSSTSSTSSNSSAPQSGSALSEATSDPADPALVRGLVRGVDGKLYPRGNDPRTRKSLRRRWKWGLVGAAALIALALIPLAGWYMLSQAPANYTAYRDQIRTSDPRQIKAIAQGLQNAVLGDLIANASQENANETNESADTPANSNATKIINGMKVQDLGTDEQGRALRRVELGPEQVNAWLAASFSEWLEYRDFDMPTEIRSPMVAVANGKTTLFFTFESESFSQVFQSEFDMKMDEKGMATMKLDNMQAGRVPVPVNAVGGLVGKAAGHNGTADRASQWIGKIQNYSFKPAMKLPDGLKAQIIQYQANGDRLTLTLRIERYRPSTQKTKVAKTESDDTSSVTTAPAASETIANATTP